MGSEIRLRQARLLGIAVLTCVLAVPAIDRAGETTTETLKLEAPQNA